MLFDRWMQSTSNVFEKNKLLTFIVIVIGLTVLYNTFEIKKIENKKRTILVPISFNTELEFIGDVPSEEYIRTITRDICNLAFTFSPVTARRQFDTLLKHYAPEFFAAGRSSLYDYASRVDATNVSSSFVITGNIDLDTQKKTIEVKGQRTLFKENAKPNIEMKTYIITYTVEGGRFFITNLSEKDSQGGLIANDTKKEKL